MMVVMLPFSSMKVSRPKDTSPKLKSSQTQNQPTTLNSSKFSLSLEQELKLDTLKNGPRSPTDCAVSLRKPQLVFIDLTKCQPRENFYVKLLMLMTVLPNLNSTMFMDADIHFQMV